MEKLSYHNASHFLKLDFEINPIYRDWKFDFDIINLEEFQDLLIEIEEYGNWLENNENFNPNINYDEFKTCYIPIPKVLGKKSKWTLKQIKKFLKEKMKEFKQIQQDHYNKIKEYTKEEYYSSCIYKRREYYSWREPDKGFWYETVLTNPDVWRNKIMEELNNLI